MANTKVRGFQPLCRTDGGQITYERKIVASSQTSAISLYDAVIRNSGGETVLATATDTAVL